ncbi:MAG: riboflavin synthase [Spirochaetaceae bacterium]|jgi:riboflavin synthase|nr:riboflavin synthase [Spirochaetaceae bacterium]
MFTGIVEEVGEVIALERRGEQAHLSVRAQKALEGSAEGDSINIDGVCQTVTAIHSTSFDFDVQAETLRKTTLGSLRAGAHVNLERALPALALSGGSGGLPGTALPCGRLGGHIVQGHIHCAAPIRELRTEGSNVYLTVEIPPPYERYCVPEGSIALDGMSLTIARMERRLVTINIIPATFEKTALRFKNAGSLMNLETDIVARYIERFVQGGAKNHQEDDYPSHQSKEKIWKQFLLA